MTTRTFTAGLAGLLVAISLSAPISAREITHAMGVTDVPDNPQRIVMLTNEGTEALLFLGVVPVGAVQSWHADPWYDHIAEPLAETVPLGTELAVNLEVLASLEPDLILGTKVRQEAIYPQLSAIAPTVMSETLGGQWQANLQFYADVIGRPEAGKAAIDSYVSRTQKLHDALGEAVNERISLVRFSPNRTRIYYIKTFAGLALEQIGFQRPQAQNKDDFAQEVTKERIPEMDGDRIFYFSNDKDEAEAAANLDEWLNDPLWRNLEGVKAGKAQRVSEIIWNTAGGIYAAHLMLDELESIYGLASTR